MKIGLVCPYNMFKGGGVQECVLALKDGLVARGHDVSIITPRSKDAPKDHDPDIILVGTARDVKSPFHTTGQISVTVDGSELDTMLKREDFDVLHFHEPWVPLISWQILNRSKAAHVATFHAKLPETVMSKTIERVVTPYTRSVLKSLDVLTAVSEAASEYVTSLTDVEPIIIPNGINLEKYQASPVPKAGHNRTITYVGRLEKRKGVAYLLKAFALLAGRDTTVHLQIIGDGPDREKLEAYVKNKRIPRVTFEGFVDEKTKIQMVREAHIFCSPALYGESFGIVLLEAMALGTVVVAGDNPGYRAVLKETGAESLVDPKDSHAFASKLERFLRDEKLRAQWQEWALAYVQQFNYDRITDMYEDAYRLALNQAKN